MAEQTHLKKVYIDKWIDTQTQKDRYKKKKTPTYTKYTKQLQEEVGIRTD